MQAVTDETFLKKLGNRIRNLRKSKNLTQLDLAGLMNNYAEQIGRIERGEQNVSICTLKLIAEALDETLMNLVDF